MEVSIISRPRKIYCSLNQILQYLVSSNIKKGYAEFPNIPQLIAKNTLPFGQIMYENLSDLIQGRTRSSRCTSFETYSTQLYRTYAYVYFCCSYSCNYDFSLCINLKILQLICAMKYVALKQKDLFN